MSLKTGVKSIQLEDYDEVVDETEQIKWLVNEFRWQCRSTKPRIDACDTISHPHKMWEWCRALHLIKERFPNPQNTLVLDIGAAYSPLGPALSYLGYNVTEAEPDGACGVERQKVNQFLMQFNNNPINWQQAGYGGLKYKAQFDVVMEISTIEHVELSLEKTAWKEMANLVKPGGLLIATADCMSVSKKGYMYDDVRWTNYDMKLVKDRVDELKSYGLKPIGKEDYTFHGNFVNDYSFMFIAMERVAI